MLRGIIVVILVTFACVTHASAESTAIGTLHNVQGEVYIDRGPDSIPAREGGPIFQNDTVRTGNQGLAGMIFQDNSSLSLGPNSALTITTFVYKPSEKTFSFVTRILKGTASYLSGVIGKLVPEAVQFHTPVASIGLRGTSLLLKVKPEAASKAY
ncbi:MAG: FecR domain-containing protein [Desulfohalobiaceae bacterium]|nr:FecR domain-containing protein [Desulfohalobiaceae bacterium]